jgi:hypothetical protein
VALIRANRTASLPQPEQASQAATDRCSPAEPGDPICWNIRQIGADRVWRDFGVSGSGIVVANIDTGVRYNHPALAAQYRGALSDGHFDHNYNWFDPLGEHPAPHDENGHGTHTMGTIVANGGAGDLLAVGVAPGARWIAAQGCNAYACDEADLIDAAQWILAPTRLDGGQPRPDLRPLIVNNSWAGAGGSDWYAGYTAAWRAAGIFPVFAAGNAGGGITQVCGSIDSPGDYADVVAVGATDQNDAIAGFSLLGPTLDGLRKPDFVAPGAYAGAGLGVLSTFPGDGASYQVLRGTSMAAPHVAGLVALLWSANPALIGDYDATYALIRDSARGRSDTRCGDTPGGPNNVYGYGRIDAYAAVARARVNVPWLTVTTPQQPLGPGGAATIDIGVDAARVPGPGTYNARVQIYEAELTQSPTTIEIAMVVTPASQQANLTGRVVSADTGAPVAATVGVKDGLGAQTDVNGVYTLTLAAGSYELVASAPAFLPETLQVLVQSDQQAPTIVMQPDQPRIVAPAVTPSASPALGKPQTISIPIGNSGTRPLLYHVRVLPDQFAMLRSDEPGAPAYSWVDLPSSAQTLKLDDNSIEEEVPLGIRFPFYGYTVTDTLITSDGTLAFSLPNQQYNGPIGRCFPTSEFHFFAIAPFRTDLDPAKGGAVRYGTIDDGKTFVLSFEQVPPHEGPDGATYTFQTLLHDDGRIVFQYRDLSELPSQLGVGIQRSPEDSQAIGCGSATPIANQLAITFQPQINAAKWLRTPIDDGAALPTAQQEITATLQWAPPYPHAIQHGRIEITSNDPIRSVVVVNVRAEMLPPPYEHRLILPGQPRF